MERAIQEKRGSGSDGFRKESKIYRKRIIERRIKGFLDK